MNVYLCARYSRHPEMRQVRAALEKIPGTKVVARWTDGNHDVSPGTLHSVAQSFAAEDLEDLLSCGAIFVFTEGPNPPGRNRGGRHVEFGIALAERMSIFLIGPRENVFHYLPMVRQFDDVGSALIAFAREHST